MHIVRCMLINGTSIFRVVKISRLQANPRKQRNYFTSKNSQYTVFHYSGHVQESTIDNVTGPVKIPS